NLRNSSGRPGKLSILGRRRGCVAFSRLLVVALGSARTLTTAGRTALTTSRYEVSSLGYTGGEDDWPCKPLLKSSALTNPTSIRQTRATGHRFILWILLY